MKRFEFSLQRVLEYKNHLEKREKDILRDMRLRHQKLCAEMDDLIKKYQIYGKICDEKCASGIEIRDLGPIKNHMSELRRRMNYYLIMIEKSEREIDRQVSCVIGISREKNTIEKLKQKHFTLYQKEEQKETESFIEDFVANAKSSGDLRVV